MTVGLSTTNLANAWLNVLRGAGNGVTFTAPSTIYVQWHTADPGASGTTSVSTGLATRQACTYLAASAGSLVLTTTLPSATATGSDTITHISLWSASTAGTFYCSMALTTSKTVASGDTLTQSTATISLAPLAA
jgi:hypothetical protein